VRERGLTLVELLAALLILGLTLAAAAGVFRWALASACRLRGNLLVQGDLQRTLALLGDDLEEWTFRVPGAGEGGPAPPWELVGAVRQGDGLLQAQGLILRKHRILDGLLRAAPVPEGADQGAWVASDRPLLLYPGDLLAPGTGPALVVAAPLLLDPAGPSEVPAAPAILEAGTRLEAIRPLQVTWALAQGHLVRTETGGGRPRRDPATRITGFRLTLPAPGPDGRPAWVEAELEGTCGDVRRRATLAVAPRNPSP